MCTVGVDGSVGYIKYKSMGKESSTQPVLDRLSFTVVFYRRYILPYLLPVSFVTVIFYRYILPVSLLLYFTGIFYRYLLPSSFPLTGRVSGYS